MKERIEIYTDGHCSGNPGPGGWGFVAIQGGRVVEEASETAADTTNNRMEMLAVIRTVEWLNSRRGKSLPSVAEFVYDWLRIVGYLGNVGSIN